MSQCLINVVKQRFVKSSFFNFSQQLRCAATGCTLAAIRTVTHVILKYALDDGSRPSIRLAVARHSLELTRSIPGSQLASIALNPIYCMTYLLIHYNHNLLESFHLPRLHLVRSWHSPTDPSRRFSV